jgi:hypothetical protein
VRNYKDLLMRLICLVSTTLLAALLVSSSAYTQTEDEDPDFTPVGYEFCGWLDFESESWQYDEPAPGAWLRLFARKMSCDAAQRNYARTRYTQTPPYRPVRMGYRCTTLDDDLEYSDVRCSKRRRPRVAFRWQTGA